MAKEGSKKTPDSILRQDRTKAIEGDFPYERRVYINQVRLILKHTADSLILAGKMLLVMREHEEHGHFLNIIENEIGIPYRTAYRFMNAARKAAQYPEIDFRKFDKLSNLYTLIEAPEDDLKELEEKGILAGHTLDDLAGMPVSELKTLIKKLRKDAEKVIGKQVAKLEERNNAITIENRELRAQIDHQTPKQIAESIKAVEKSINTAIDIIANLDLSAPANSNKSLRRKLQSRTKKLQKQVEVLMESI